MPSDGPLLHVILLSEDILIQFLLIAKLTDSDPMTLFQTFGIQTFKYIQIRESGESTSPISILS